MKKKYKLETMESEKKSHKKIPTVDIILYVVGGLLLVGTIIALVVIFSKKPKKKPSEPPGPSPPPGPGPSTNCSPPCESTEYCLENTIEHFGKNDKSSTSPPVCKHCPIGNYISPSGTSCTPCPSGKYGSKIGVGESSVCTPCPAGKYQSSTGKTSCTPCASGTSQGSKGQISCTPCASGTSQSSKGQTSCTPCASGTYQNHTGQTECMYCGLCLSSTDINNSKHIDSPCTATSNTTCLYECSEEHPCDNCKDQAGVCFNYTGKNTGCVDSGKVQWNDSPCDRRGTGHGKAWCGNCMYGAHRTDMANDYCCGITKDGKVVCGGSPGPGPAGWAGQYMGNSPGWLDACRIKRGKHGGWPAPPD